jgi:hypothetical protein
MTDQMDMSADELRRRMAVADERQAAHQGPGPVQEDDPGVGVQTLKEVDTRPTRACPK